MANMKISAAGVGSIKQRHIDEAGEKAIEQREGERLKAYPDSRGIPTIGTGHTGPEVHLGLVWTQAQADAALASDLGWAEAAVNEAVKVPLTQNQFDALVSVTFNIGAAGFKGSSIVKQLNLGNYAEAANDFMMWDKPSVLVKRREGEKAQFLSQVGGNAAPGNPTVTPTSPKLPDVSTFAGIKAALILLGFGTEYSKAVVSFQAWAHLTQDGIVGPLTQAALRSALASLTKK